MLARPRSASAGQPNIRSSPKATQTRSLWHFVLRASQTRPFRSGRQAPNGMEYLDNGQAMPEHSGKQLDKDEVVRNLRDAPGQPLIGERSLTTSPAPELTNII